MSLSSFSNETNPRTEKWWYIGALAAGERKAATFWWWHSINIKPGLHGTVRRFKKSRNSFICLSYWLLWGRYFLLSSRLWLYCRSGKEYKSRNRLISFPPLRHRLGFYCRNWHWRINRSCTTRERQVKSWLHFSSLYSLCSFKNKGFYWKYSVCHCCSTLECHWSPSVTYSVSLSSHRPTGKQDVEQSTQKNTLEWALFFLVICLLLFFLGIAEFGWLLSCYNLIYTTIFLFPATSARIVHQNVNTGWLKGTPGGKISE